MKNKTKKYFWIGLCCLIVSCILSGSLLQADNDADKKKSSITMDWEEFQKILKLDKDEIKLSWDEFTKLLSMTGSRVKPEYKVEGGNVILTREQFKKLIDQMKPPRRVYLEPPCDYLIRKANYNGVVANKSTQFIAILDIEIFKKDKKTYLKIPLFREELAIEDIRFDGKPASIITEGGWHYLNTDDIGKHTVRVKFSVRSLLDIGTPGFNFNIPQSPITYITLDIPKKNIDVIISNAQEIQTNEFGRHTVVKGYLTPTSEMRILWKKKSVEIARGPAKIYAELYNLLSIEADAIRVTTKIKMNILQNKITSITLITPSDYQILEVTGHGKNIWNVREEDGKQILYIPFEYPIDGNQYITIKSEKSLPKETMVADFDGFEIMDAIRESGFIAGEVKSNAEAHVREFKGLDRIDFQKVPSELSGLSTRPIQFAFKYIRHPYSIVVDITKYEREEALSAIIDYARGTTLFEEDGKLVHQFTFSIQNLWNQFLKLDLPKDASIWSVYVDGKREKPSRDSDGKILIPLVRSMREDGILKPFDVEIIYSEPVSKFTIFGKKEQSLPTPDIIINRIEWNLYLPVNYKYINFGGNLKRSKKVEISDEMVLITKDIDISSGKLAEPSAPLEKKKEVTLGVAGLLSVRVNIPISGKNYLFTKKIVEKGEPLHLGFSYVDERIIYWFIVILILVFLFILFKIRRIFIPVINLVTKFLSNFMPLVKNCLKPKVLPITILIILLISILLKVHRNHPLIFIVIIIIFLISLARLFTKQTKDTLKLLWQPAVTTLIVLLLFLLVFVAIFIKGLVPLFFLLLLLLFIGLIISIIRLIISTLLRKKKEKKE